MPVLSLNVVWLGYVLFLRKEVQVADLAHFPSEALLSRPFWH